MTQKNYGYNAEGKEGRVRNGTGSGGGGVAQVRGGVAKRNACGGRDDMRKD